MGNLVPRALNFFHLSVNKKMPWVRYRLGGPNFCLRSCRKINSHKMESFNISTLGDIAETMLVITFVTLLFFRNNLSIKYMISHKLHRRTRTSDKHTRWSLFTKIVSWRLALVSYFSEKAPSKMFDEVLNKPLNYIPINTIS